MLAFSFSTLRSSSSWGPQPRTPPNSRSWGPPPGTPYPTYQPAFSPANPPNSASSWTYGSSYPPWAPPPGWGSNTPAQAQAPAWGQTPDTSWGAQTPGGTWGAPTPASFPPQTPAAYSPWMPPNQQQGGPGTWLTPNMVQNPQHGPGPTQSFDISDGQPITAGWFGAGNVGRTGYPDGNWSNPPTPKKRSNSIKRTHSQGKSPRRTPLQRSSSWGEFGANYPGAASGYVPPYASGDLYDEKNLARRPRDWRPDYEPRMGLSAYIPRVGRNRSDIRGTFNSFI